MSRHLDDWLERYSINRNIIMHLSKKDLKRFWWKVNVKEPNDCWEWKSCISKSGYGIFHLNGYPENAHRVSLFISKGFKNEMNFALHICDNKLCVNPKHLYEGTQMDNMIDKCRRTNHGITSNKLNEECVKVIRWMFKYKNKKGLGIKLAKLYNVHYSTISCIKLNKTWNHITV